MKYIVLKEKTDTRYSPNGDGPMTEKTAARIVREIRTECGVKAKSLPVGQTPNED